MKMFSFLPPSDKVLSSNHKIIIIIIINHCWKNSVIVKLYKSWALTETAIFNVSQSAGSMNCLVLKNNAL